MLRYDTVPFPDRSPLRTEGRSGLGRFLVAGRGSRAGGGGKAASVGLLARPFAQVAQQVRLRIALPSPAAKRPIRIMSEAVATIAAEPGADLLRALRRLRGKATLGDVVSATGLPRNEAESALKKLLETRRGHLDVSDSGELLYRFDPKLISRDHTPFWVRFRKAAWTAFKTGFKVWTAVMLVVYFVVFVVLVIAAMTANRDGDRGGGFGGRRGGGFSLGDLFLMHWLFGGRGWGRGSLYYGHRHARRLPKDAQPPFYKKVFAFIFGPEEPRPTQLQRDRSVLQLVRARNGVLTTAELVEHTALPLPEAEEEMGRLVGAYGGDPTVSNRGEVVFAFPELMRSAHGRVRAREPKPAWLRLEYPRKLTGNSSSSNAIIGAMNGFNLAAGSAIGLGLVPALTAAAGGVAGQPMVFWGLGVVPATFSALFFAIPALRAWGVARENARRQRRNVRRILLELVYRRSVEGIRWVSAGDAARHAGRALRSEPGAAARLAARLAATELQVLASEFGADVEADDEGFRYRFPAIRRVFVDAEMVRRKLRLGDQRLGEVVYSTSDTEAEAAKRDMAAFDRELAGAEVDLSRYLPSLGEVGYEEDFEVVMDEARRRPARVQSSRSRPRPRRPGSWPAR